MNWYALFLVHCLGVIGCFMGTIEAPEWFYTPYWKRIFVSLLWEPAIIYAFFGGKIYEEKPIEEELEDEQRENQNRTQSVR